MGFGQSRGSAGPRQQVTGRVFPTTVDPRQNVPSEGPTIRPGITAPAPTGVEMRQALMDLFGIYPRPELQKGTPLGPVNPATGMTALSPMNPGLQNPLMGLFGGPMGGGGLLAQGLLSAIFRRMIGGW